MWDRVRRQDQTNALYLSFSPSLFSSRLSLSLFIRLLSHSTSIWPSLSLSFHRLLRRGFFFPFGRTRARKHATSFSLLLEANERLSFSATTSTRHRLSFDALCYVLCLLFSLLHTHAYTLWL